MLMKIELKAKRCQRCSSTSRIMTDMSEHLGEQTRQNEEEEGQDSALEKETQRRNTWSRLLLTDKQGTQLSNFDSNNCIFLISSLMLVLVRGNREKRGVVSKI